MKKYFRILILPLIILGSSCSSIEIFKENTEFRPYKKYLSFVILNKEIGHKGFNDDYLDVMVSDRIQNQLESRGLVYEKENPELIIRYTSNEDLRQKEIYNNLYPMWGGRIWDPWMYDPRFMNQRNMTSTRNYELMQVVVDFIDPKNDKMLMRLTAVSEVSSQKEKNRRALKSVDKIIQTYQEHIN
ncbi:DUF4136 domain-containing protein [Aquiflexum lacus]|uniref:DUF4136 domain-containing protein n=1 Tax=Aquiflexum lacus TaxID=2483805 RepID=UPI001E378ABD|nr:DUF4136 domain-containing protein [Aquiflexum lacus]